MVTKKEGVSQRANGVDNWEIEHMNEKNRSRKINEIISARKKMIEKSNPALNTCIGLIWVGSNPKERRVGMTTAT